MKKLYFILFAMLSVTLTFAQGTKEYVSNLLISQSVLENKTSSGYSVEGQLRDTHGNPLLFANVGLYKDGKLLGGVETDLDGNFKFVDLTTGVYDLEASYIGYSTNKLCEIRINKNIKNLNIILTESEFCCYHSILIDYKKPLINLVPNGSTTTFTSDEISNRY